MNRSHSLARAVDALGPRSSAVVLFALLAQVAACAPELEPAPGSSSPAPTNDTNVWSPDAQQVQTAEYTLTAPLLDTGGGVGSAPGSGTVIRGMLTQSSFGATDDYRYDAFVVTARESGTVSLRSDVLESQRYPYGYGYPLDLLHIDAGFELSAWASVDYQNALETGTAILAHQVMAGRQYILIYKTFDAFTPLTYGLTVPPTLTVEGQISRLPVPVPMSPNGTGLITRENPRPEVLEQFMGSMPQWTSYHH